MASRWHLHPLRVRYQETDQMAVVYHINYLNWFEIGRTEWIRHAGYRYADIEQSGLLLPLIDLESRFLLPARYDEQLIICTRIASFSPLRLTFESEVRRVASWDGLPQSLIATDERPGELLVSGATRHVWVNREWRPARLDRHSPEVYEALKQLCEGGD
ncbi:acyl-CoA thioesterase [Paenibacillus daejeonensis]|uniref:acyl-CoA thioesterase n=1 Tax=Paenibacillus daejeonensis TaxID=135193 RepID=UPI000361EBCA|nr:thioesterase family protein [Paenibacillus daejeonensis]